MSLSRELKHALRSLARSPGFSAAVVLILSLGVGANAAIYSVVRAVILRPLPFPEPDRLVVVPARHHPNEMGEEVSPGNFLDWRRESRSFERLGAFGPATLNLMHGGSPERLQAAQITPGALEAFGTKPLLGRLFFDEEEASGSRLAILSYGLWKSHFAGDPAIVGRTIRLSGIEHPVVGVMPPEFRFPRGFPDEVRLWVPFRFTPERAADRQSRWIYAMGRLKPGVSIAAAQREMDALTAALARQYPSENGGWGARVASLQEHLVGRVRPALLILLGTALLVLLVACANIGNLELARASSRRSEMAVRSALGASRAALLRPLLFEASALAVAGAAAGVFLAHGSLRLLMALAPRDIPRLDEVRIDGGVFVFALGVSLLTAILFALAPALLAWRARPSDDLRDGRGSSGAKHARVRRLVTVAEVAGALVLLVGAALLLTSLRRLGRVEPGFDAKDVMTMEVVLPRARYPDDAKIAAFFGELSQRAARLPGVESAGGVSHLPLSGSNSTEGYLVEGRPPADPNEIPEAAIRVVTPDYIRTVRIPLIAGRDFTAADTAESPRVLLVNRTFADLYWGVGEAVGKRIFFAGSQGRSPAWEVVGVVGDIRHSRLDLPAVPEIYTSYAQGPYDNVVLTVRSKAAPETLARMLRAEAARIDPEQPVFNLRTMESVLDESISEPRFTTTLLSVFAVLALVLAAAGISSVIAYSVASRRREIGIRIALGSPRRRVLGLVLREAMGLAGGGIGAGLLLSLPATRGMSGLLFGVRPHDPWILGSAAALLAAVALAASLVPAFRASRVSPLAVLRSP